MKKSSLTCRYSDCDFFQENKLHAHCRRCGEMMEESYRKLCDDCRNTSIINIRNLSGDSWPSEIGLG